MQKKIREFMEEYHMTEPGDVVLCGLSGGADSVYLFHILLELREELGYTVQAVHVNHNLRGEEADRDAAFVEALCQEKQVPFFLYSCPVEQMARDEHLSIEEAGRAARQAVFADCMEQHGATKLALAHHQNDLAETMLYNLARGTSLAGLASLRPVREHVIRPLLCTNRREIEQELLRNKISWCEDSSNSQDTYIRNGIRHHVIPYLTRKVNDQFPLHTAQASLDILEAEEYLEEQAEKICLRYVTGEGKQIRISCAVRQEPVILTRYLIRMCLEKLAKGRKDLTREHIASVLELLGKSVGKQAVLPYRMRAWRDYDAVVLEIEDGGVERDELPDEVILPQEGTVAYGPYRITVQRVEYQESQKRKEETYTKFFDCDKIKHTLVVRTRRTGDYLTVNAQGGRKKLKDYMIDAKIPQKERDSVLLVADGEEIVWAAGWRQGETYRIHPGSRNILQIQIQGGSTDE